MHAPLRASIVALVIAQGLEAHAQFYQSVFPESLDFSGIWVVEGVPVPQGSQPANRCDRLWKAESNWPLFGRTWLEIQATGTTYDNTNRDTGPIIRMQYSGVLHFFQGYGSETYGEGASTVIVDYYCHLEQIDYAIQGELIVIIDIGDILFGMTGPVIAPAPPYEHQSQGGAGFTVFLDAEGRLAIGGVGGSGEALGAPGVRPDGCPLRLRPPAHEFSLTQCQPISGYPMHLRRSDRAPDGTPKQPVRGVLIEGEPDGTDTGNPVPVARVRLFQQDGALRARRANETIPAYDAYVTAFKANRKLIAEVAPGTDGRFEIPDVEIIERIEDGRGTGFKRAIYTLDVSGGEKDEIDSITGERSTVYFLATEEDGVKAGDDKRLVLIPATDLGVKLDLTERLIALAPNQYGPIEEAMKAYLGQLLNNTVTLTPERNEGVRRAIWSERSVAIGAEFATTMIQVMLENLADWVADLLGDRVSTKSKQLKDAEERLGNLKEAADFAKAEQKGLQAFSQYSNSSGVMMLTGAMDKLMEDVPRLGPSKHWDLIKKIFKFGLFMPIKFGLIELGIGPAAAEELVGHIEGKMFVALDAIMQGERGEAYKAVIKFLITSLQSTLMDSSFDSFPSYASMTKQSLANARDRSIAWSTVNDTLYQQDRGLCVEQILTLSNRSTEVLRGAYFAKGLAEGLGDGADVLELIPNPAFQSAAKIAKFAKNVAVVESFVSPAIYTFGVLPGDTDVASYFAFGMAPPSSLVLLPTAATRVENDIRISAAFSDSIVQTKSALEQIRTHLTNRNYPAAILLATDDSPMGLLGRMRTMDERFDWLMATAGGSATDSQSINVGMRAAGLAFFEAQAALSQFLVELRGLFLDAMEGRDVSLEAKAASVIEQAKAAANRLELVPEPLIDLYGFLNTNPIVPPVVLDGFKVVSATGKDRITTSPETFTVEARLHNLSKAPIAGAAVRLRVYTPTGTATVTTARLMAAPSLAVDDGVDGTGPDEFPVTFSFTYGGPLETLESISVQLTVEENGGRPVNFVASERSAMIAIDPAVADGDADGIPAALERRYGLDPTVDDANLDADADGLGNKKELAYGTRPDQADTDQDGLSDFEEVYGGADGFATDPLRADTDGDGSDDSTDRGPNDGTTTGTVPVVLEPSVMLGANELILGEDNALGSVDVGNGGAGTLSWTAFIEPNELISIGPAAPTVLTGPGRVTATLHRTIRRIPAELEGRGFVVKVRDVSGLTPDEQQLIVWIVRRGELTDGGVPGNDGSVTDSGSGVDSGSNPGVDGGVGPGPGPEDMASSGCGCSAVEDERPWPLGLVALLLTFVRRRRPR